MPYEHLNRAERRAMAKHSSAEALKRPSRLTTIPREQWPHDIDGKRMQVWHSNRFLVQMFQEQPFQGIECRRLSICRVTLQVNGKWDEGLSWDDLYTIKRELGFSDWFGVEIHPPIKDLVNVANMRHLWLLREPLELGWKRV